jgi:LacI family transcriptional regulator
MPKVRASSKKSASPPKVALLVETSNAYARGMLAGVEEFISARGPWTVYLGEHGRGDRPPAWLERWDGDGIIARVENENIARALESMRVPVVNLSFTPLIAAAPTFTTDNEGIAELAATHFLERGFQHFAYCGREEFAWSIDRGEAFSRRLAREGKKCVVFARPARVAGDSDAEVESIASWLRKLPKPVAVLACYDFRGQQVLDAARRAGCNVPDEVAVLGVDNDELLCALSPPPLSSVILNARRSGWLAAEALELMMRGEAVPAEVTHVAPLGVATRQSTDTMAVEDVQVAKAVRFMREHACRGIDVSDVLRACPMSRRSLELRMKAVLGRTPHGEILRVQIARAKQLLAGTSLSLPEVADKCGFRHAEYLSVAFKRETGAAPSEYRKSHGRLG